MDERSPLHVTVLLFDGVEELDAIGPWETLRFWQLLTENRVIVRTASVDGNSVRCSLGLTFTPDSALDDGPRPDILVHPGGAGVEQLRADGQHLSRLQALAAAGSMLASVCNGALVLAAAGLLDGREATTHWSARDDLTSTHPAVTVCSDQRVVDAGDVVTAAGITAGIDMSLHMIERFESSETAISVAKILEYAWEPGSAHFAAV